MKKQKAYYEQSFTELTRKHYNRWRGILDRCYNENYHNFATIGGRGIKVALTWVNTNPKGLENFANWIEEQLVKEPKFNNVDFKIYRHDNDLDYSPENCKIGSLQLAIQRRISTVLDFDSVVELRTIKRANPEISLGSFARLYCVSKPTIARALCGDTWANVNEVVAPITIASRINVKTKQCIEEDETEDVS